MTAVGSNTLPLAGEGPRPRLATEHEHPSRGAETLLALGLSFVLAIRFAVSPGVPVCYMIATVFLPVTLSVLRRFRGITWLVLLSVASVVSGLVLTWLAADSGLSNHSQAIVQTSRAIGIGVSTLALLWARSVVGTRRVVLFYGLGGLASLPLAGLSPDNVWKFSLSVPVTLIVLGLPWVYRRPVVEAFALAALAGVSALNDGRSAAAMMLIGAALVMSQGTRSHARRTNSFLTMGRLAMIAVGGFYLVQAAILNGELGEAAQARTEAQIQTSGSVLLGGRPEIGASFSLITARPSGYGAGALASGEDLINAKTGMAALGYNPNNGYVETYMFGKGFEVHSILGDLWILFGFAGMALALAIALFVVSGLGRSLSHRVATGALLFLAIRSLWDTAFSPLASAMWTLTLTLAVVFPTREELDAPSEERIPA